MPGVVRAAVGVGLHGVAQAGVGDEEDAARLGLRALELAEELAGAGGDVGAGGAGGEPGGEVGARPGAQGGAAVVVVDVAQDVADGVAAAGRGGGVVDGLRVLVGQSCSAAERLGRGEGARAHLGAVAGLAEGGQVAG